MNKKINKLITYSKDGILSQEIVKNKKLSITLFCMGKGTEISDHTSTKQGFIYVIEGDGVFNLAEKNISMSSGVLIHLEKNTVHSLKAHDNTSFILALINS